MGALRGVVYDPQAKVLPKALILLRSERGEVVRATKTNDFGEFSLTALPAGTYQVEVQNPPFSFATISVEITGEKLEEVTLKGQG